jgi:type VI secretion system protein
MAFFDRFNPSRSASFSQKKDEELEHVVKNLTAILNTKQGFGSVVGKLGIGDYLAAQGSRDSLRALTQEITEEITRYEPRLLHMELTFVGKTPDLHLVFIVTGTVAGKRCKLRLLFHTTFGNVVIETLTP